ncbi:MAG: lipid-binding SYLF domain-containing protein [Acidobacteriota bacterium]|nr:MAG: lipid-binding SYLF domain-containing protein [Acidobacteriota bacterium]
MKRRFVRLSSSLVFVSSLCFSLVSAADGNDRLLESAKVLGEILNIPEGIPQSLLDRAECVVVIPSVKKFALGIGGSYGKGAMVCRGGDDYTGPWGAPAMFRLEGGSIGFQLGGSATDFVLLIVNPRGAESILKSKVKLGADAAAAAGPKGRSAEAATDALMTAEILTYSRSKGLFAGVSLNGSTLRQDTGANEDVYGKEISAREIVVEKKVGVTSDGRPLVDLLQKQSPKNLSD